MLKALDELEAVLRENAENERLLAKRIADVRQARESGQEWKAILGDEDEPGTVQLVSAILRRQSEASGYLRRSLVVALRAEGQSIPSIAHLFGVTHQRVSNLLRRVAQGNADGNGELGRATTDTGGRAGARAGACCHVPGPAPASTSSASVMMAPTISATGGSASITPDHLTGGQDADVGASRRPAPPWSSSARWPP